MALRHGAKRMPSETSARGTTWASWMDDRTTTAYSPYAHRLVGRAPAAPAKRASTAPATRRGQTAVLRMAPAPAASTRSDDAGLMWLDEADLMSVVEPTFTAAESGSIVAKCVLPTLGLFAAVLFGHIILAASGQVAPVALPRAAASELAGASPRSAADTPAIRAGTDAAAAPGPDGLQRSAAESGSRAAAEAGSRDANVASHASGTDTAAFSSESAVPQAAAAHTIGAVPHNESVRGHRHHDDGAQGSGAGSENHAAASQQSGLLRINSRPWAQVTLDGNALGHTPLFDVQVAPGAHTLRLDNPDFQVSKTLRVDVAPGETVTRVVSLQE